jgi:hypothetical protein
MAPVDATRFAHWFAHTLFHHWESFGGLDVARNFGFVCY